MGAGTQVWLTALEIGGILLIRPFRVPLYPVLPIIFCATSAYLLFASIAYAGWSAFAGIVLLGLGTLLSFLITFVPITPAKEELAL